MQLEHATSVARATLRCTSVDGSTQRVHLRNQTSRDPHRGCSFAKSRRFMRILRANVAKLLCSLNSQNRYLSNAARAFLAPLSAKRCPLLDEQKARVHRHPIDEGRKRDRDHRQHPGGEAPENDRGFVRYQRQPPNRRHGRRCSSADRADHAQSGTEARRQSLAGYSSGRRSTRPPPRVLAAHMRTFPQQDFFAYFVCHG
jgi:hypothetical protein